MNLKPVTIRIAKPMEDIEEEYLSLLREYMISLFLCTLFILIISYKLAGKILQPFTALTSLAQEIQEESLHTRIPLSDTRDEFHELSCALNRMFDRLQYSFERQREFIGNASHELKSPLTLLKLAQEDLLINFDLPDPVRNNLDRQLTTTLRMSKLVKNLLDLSRLEQLESVVCAPIDLQKLISQVIDDYSDLLAAQNIRVDCALAGDLTMQGDPEKMQRLFINLIENSIRYNRADHGYIQIRGEKKGETLSLEIANPGTKIPEEDLTLIFEQFYRVDKSRSTLHGGTGLGLTIARRIIELHKGTITLSNKAEGLIAVSLSLPVNQSYNSTAHNFEPTSPPPSL